MSQPAESFEISRKIPQLDGLRGIAILAVLLMHLTGRPVGGGLGVDLFFVLSGFLITALLLAERESTGTISLPRFYARRALRILPPLFAALALTIVITPTPFASTLPAIFFYANFVDMPRALGHMWSLSIEEHFYFAWPILITLWPRRAISVLAILIVVSLALRSLLPAFGWSQESSIAATFCRMDALALGCGAALSMKQPRRTSEFTMTIAVLGIILTLAFLNTPWWSAALFPFALLCTAAIAGILTSASSSPMHRLLATPPLRYLGLRSYGIYLYSGGSLLSNPRTLRTLSKTAEYRASVGLGTRGIDRLEKRPPEGGLFV
jgi:peptidoglycan/LPS O-acetylase OafA/YrhL